MTDRELTLECLRTMFDWYNGKHAGYECRPAFLPQLRRIIRALENDRVT
jgi:hypothetical protein